KQNHEVYVDAGQPAQGLELNPKVERVHQTETKDLFAGRPLGDLLANLVDFGITAAVNVCYLRPRRESIDSILQSREQIVIFLAKDVFVERAGDRQRKEGRTSEVFIRPLNVAVSSPSIQID